MTTTSAEEKEYYSVTKKVFDILACFYNLMTLPLDLLNSLMTIGT